MGLLLPSVTFAQEQSCRVAEVERVIVTGSNIPTAEEVGPNPVDTYRPADIEKLGIRNCHGPADQSAAGDGHDHQPEHVRWR